jgi:hypothetical protein
MKDACGTIKCIMLVSHQQKLLLLIKFQHPVDYHTFCQNASEYKRE